LQDERELSNKLKSFYKNSNDLKFCFSIESIKLAYNDIFIYHREILDRYKNGKHKGIKWITSLNNKKDVELVKLYINDGIEIRHVKDLFTNSFILSDKEILLSTIKKKEKETIVTNFLSRNDKIYLNYYNAIFEDLWKEGININEKITDIEAGHYVNVKIILNPKESLKIINEFVYKKTKKELLLILSSTNAFFRIENNNDFVSLEKLTDQRIAVKVLIPEKKELKYKIEQIKMKYSKIEFREFNTYHEPFIGIIIIDRENVLLIEIKDDIKKDYINSLGLTIIIEGNSAALSYFSIFESLWKQTELYLQLQRNDLYKSDFLSMFSHELKTPLVPIKGYTEMLLKPHLLGDLNNNQVKAIQSIYRNMENLESLIQNILNIYSVDSKKTTITKKISK
jgi:hypothetical protein